MSDYSCTTINSEMNRSIGGNEVSEEEDEEDADAEPFELPNDGDQQESYSQEIMPNDYLNKNKKLVVKKSSKNNPFPSNLRKVPRPEDDMPPPPIEKPPSDSEEDDQYIQPYQQQQVMSGRPQYKEYQEPPPQQQRSQPRPVQDQNRGDRISDPAKLPFSQRVNLFKQSQADPSRQEYKNYIK